jgi:Flp pilus assembly protein TadD
LEPTNNLAGVLLADVFVRAQLPNQALQEVAQLRARGSSAPLAPQADVELARIEATAQFALGNKSQAEQMLKDAYARHPKFPGVLDTLLQIYAQTDRLDDAIQAAEGLVKSDPDRVESSINLATLYFRKNDFTNAMASVDRVLQKSPQQPQALLYKIFLLIQAKDFAKARSSIDALLNVEPDNPGALLYKGVVEIETKNHAKAIEPLSQLLKKQPNNADALRNRAVAYLQLGELSKAEKDYTTMRRLVARDYVYVAYYGLGEIAYKRNDMETARKYYELYLQYAPKSDSPDLLEEKKMVKGRLQSLPAPKR